MKGALLAAERRADEMIALAWHVEAIGRSDRSKRLPPLARLLARKKAPADEQTPDEMLEVLRHFKASGAPMNIRRIA